MREIISVTTDKRETLVDITEQVRRVVSASGIADGIVSVYAQGATAVAPYSTRALPLATVSMVP